MDNRFPWNDNTSGDIASQTNPRYETPMGAQQKANTARDAAIEVAALALAFHKSRGNNEHPLATISDAGFMSAADKYKADTSTLFAQENQNAFSGVNDISATTKTDNVYFVGGVGITVSTDPATKKVTITATGTATPGPHASSHLTGGSDPIPLATVDADGLAPATLIKEIEDARETYPTLSEHLEAMEGSIAEQSQTIKYDGIKVNVKNPPANLQAAKGDGSNETTVLQNIIDYIEPFGGVIDFPPGVYGISSSLIFPQHVSISGSNSRTTFISALEGFSTQGLFNGMVVFFNPNNHCEGSCVSNITISVNHQQCHGILGYSLYDSVVFENVIVADTGADYSSYRFVPNPNLLDKVSQTILLLNCLAYVGSDQSTAALYYFEHVQEASAIGCKAFAGRDFPVVIRSQSETYEFVNCRGISVIGCSMGAGPVKIVSSQGQSNGFFFAGNTFESCPRILEIYGEESNKVVGVKFIGNRNEGSGGGNPEYVLNNLTTSDIEIIVGTYSANQVDLTNITNPASVRYINETFSVSSSGTDVFKTTYPFTGGRTSLSVVLNADSVASLRDVEVGPINSAGEGYRLLRVTNN